MKQFGEMKEYLRKKDVRLKISADAVNVNVFYPNVEFLVFKNGQYQFGDQDCNKRSIVVK